MVFDGCALVCGDGAEGGGYGGGERGGGADFRVRILDHVAEGGEGGACEGFRGDLEGEGGCECSWRHCGGWSVFDVTHGVSLSSFFLC